MKIGLITTLGTNLGDDLVREGIVHLLRDVFAGKELEFVTINKHHPLTIYPKWHPIQLSEVANRLPRGNARISTWMESIFWKLGFNRFEDCELIVQCGAPVAWPGCHLAEWAKPIWYHVVGALAEKVPVLNLAAGSCYAWESPPAGITSPEETAYIRAILSYCTLTSSRDRLTRDLFASLGVSTPLLPCSALLSAGRGQISREKGSFVLINYMRGAGHYDWDQQIDDRAWEKTLCSVISRLRRRYEIKFLCHSDSEYRLADKIDPSVPRLLPRSPEEFFAMVKGAKAALCNRLHASVGIASLGIPSVSVGTDTRMLMIETLGLPFHYVKEADAETLEMEVERLFENPELQEQLLEVKERTWREYRRTVVKALESFSAEGSSKRAGRIVPDLVRAVYRAPRRAIGVPIINILNRLTSPEGLLTLGGVWARTSKDGALVECEIDRARKIAVIRPDAVGDLVLMSPFLRELRRSSPTARISLLIDGRTRNLVELCPYLNEILTIDTEHEGATGNLRSSLRAIRYARTQMKSRAFDMVLLPRWDVDYYQSAAMAYFSGARNRIGYAEGVHPGKQHYNHGLDKLLTRAIYDCEPKHEVERNLDFLRAVGGTVKDDSLELWLSEEDRENAKRALESGGVCEDERIIGLAPGAGHPKRQWPLGRFIQLGLLLLREFDGRIVIVGGPGDLERAARLSEALGHRAVSLAGQTTLRQTAAVMERTNLVIANDSGPMHLAAAAGVPVLEISCHPGDGDPLHENAPQRFHPWEEQYAVVQPVKAKEPCSGSCEWHDAHCILGVSVEMVFAAVRAVQLKGGTTSRLNGAPRG